MPCFSSSLTRLDPAYSAGGDVLSDSSCPSIDCSCSPSCSSGMGLLSCSSSSGLASSISGSSSCRQPREVTMRPVAWSLIFLSSSFSAALAGPCVLCIWRFPVASTAHGSRSGVQLLLIIVRPGGDVMDVRGAYGLMASCADSLVTHTRLSVTTGSSLLFA